jgi:hypothetical protein
MAGNPNPSPETRFQPGSTPNPGGKTKELKALETEAALMAAKLRHAQLSSMMERLEGGTDALDLLSPDALRLFKDSEDRAHGTPKASTEITGDAARPVSIVQYTVIDPKPE